MHAERIKSRFSGHNILLPRTQFKDLSLNIINHEAWARYLGDLPLNTEIIDETILQGAVLDGGYQDLSFVYPEILDSFSRSQSYDIEIITTHKSNASEFLGIKLSYYGLDGVKYSLNKNDDGSYSPRNECEFSKNSPLFEKLKLSEDEFKLLLVGISNNHIDTNFLNNISFYSLENIAKNTIVQAELTAKHKIVISNYCNEDLTDFSTFLVPGSQLRVTRNIEFVSNEELDRETSYEISSRISEFFEYHTLDGDIIPIWTFIDYALHFDIDQNDKIINKHAEINITLQEKSFEKILPLGWLDFRKEEISRSAKKDLPILIKDSIDSIFTAQKITKEDQLTIQPPTTDSL